MDLASAPHEIGIPDIDQAASFQLPSPKYPTTYVRARLYSLYCQSRFSQPQISLNSNFLMQSSMRLSSKMLLACFWFLILAQQSGHSSRKIKYSARHTSQNVCSQAVVTECARQSLQRGQKMVMPSSLVVCLLSSRSSALGCSSCASCLASWSGSTSTCFCMKCDYKLPKLRPLTFIETSQFKYIPRFYHLYSKRLIYFTILQMVSPAPKRYLRQQGIQLPISWFCIWNSKPQDSFAFNLNGPLSRFLTTSRLISSRQDSQFITSTSRISTSSAYYSLLLSLRQRQPYFSCLHSPPTGLSTMISRFMVEYVVAVYRFIWRWDARRTTWSIEWIFCSFSSTWYLIFTSRVIRVQQIYVFQISISRQMHAFVFKFFITLCLTGTSHKLMVVQSSISGGLCLGCQMRQQKRKPKCGCLRSVELTETLASSCELKESSGRG